MSQSKALVIGLIVFILIALRFFSFFTSQEKLVAGQQISLQARLSEEPELSNKGQSFAVKTADNQTIYIKTNVAPRYHYGDQVAITGSLQVSENDKGRSFYHMQFPKVQVLPRSNNLFLEASYWVRTKSAALFQETLPPISASLLSGIVFGAKEDFPDQFKEQLQNAGVMHIIVASGSNISFVVGALLFSLSTFLKRRIAIIVSVFGIIFYSCIVGFEASIIRASLMAIVVFTASLLGRPVLAFASLFMSGLFMLLWQPAFLFDVGFQLSFLATLGILILREPLVTLSWFKRLGGWGEDIATTIAAELAILPILLGVFGKVGVLSLLVNALILWTVPILMVLGSLSLVVGLVFAPLGKVLLFLALPFLVFFEKIVSLFGGLGWNVTIDTFPWQLGVGYYLLLLGVVLANRKHQ